MRSHRHVTLTREDAEGSQRRQSRLLRLFAVFAAQSDVASFCSTFLFTLLLTTSASAQPTFLIERIEVAGVERVSAGVIVYESRLSEGTAYSEQELSAANDRLRRLPFVLDATFALQKGSARDRYVLVITVNEARPLFYDLDLVPLYLLEDAYRVSTTNGAVLGARFFAGARNAFHFGGFAKDSPRPFTNDLILFQAGYTRYGVFGTGALVTLAINQTTSTGSFQPEVVVALPLSGNQTMTLLYKTSETSLELERVIEARWSVNSTNHPFFPTRGLVISAGPIVSLADGERRPVFTETVPFHSRAYALEGELKRYWEIDDRWSMGAELIAGGANIDQEIGSDLTEFTQAYGEGTLRLARSLSSTAQAQSRLELTLRTAAIGSDLHQRDRDVLTELSLSWSRRNAWGALRFGAGFAW